jgi:signal transduction histidine kinase
VEGSGLEMHPIVRDEVYRIASEAIRNACSHSGASRLAVELSYVDGLVLRVRDNGNGFNSEGGAENTAGHFGLVGMYERAARIRGKLTVSSSPGAGTQVELIVPRSVVFPREQPAGRLEKIRRFWKRR